MDAFQTMAERAPADALEAVDGESRADRPDMPAMEFFWNSSGRRVFTDSVVASQIRRAYPTAALVISPESTCNLAGYAAAGHAEFTPIPQGPDGALVPYEWKMYSPPAKTLDGDKGALVNWTYFGKYACKWRGENFVVYQVRGSIGTEGYSETFNNYILADSREKAEEMVVAAGSWNVELHDEIWVFDGGWWSKSRELYKSAMKSSWDNIILDPQMKKDILSDHLAFFAGRQQYERLRVPWKRGIIYHGPPGNGKTITIKATMRTLVEREPRVPSLYVRSLNGEGEWAVAAIFAKARAVAPCYLIFEDIDSLIDSWTRSYFLNEVDGLKNNDGIFMIASTNHLELLDPGISKRPSRFDRKYLFPDPEYRERVLYCQFWQRKLADNDDVDFADELCDKIAALTNGFSFAYMQEAFVAALLAMARRTAAATSGDHDEPIMDEAVLVDEPATCATSPAASEPREGEESEDEDGWVQISAGNAFWEEMRRQIRILREGMEGAKVN